MWEKLDFEFGWNFKGLWTLWGKSQKFIKIISWYDLQEYNFL
jgi:hypothetical protein